LREGDRADAPGDDSPLAANEAFLGNGSPGRIDPIAERLPRYVVPFDVLPEFAHLQIHP
jgi:hypothetical protein